MSELRSLISQYLSDQKLMQLATVADGKPWVCTVWQASDNELNIFFFSSVTRRHSHEVAEDENVAGALALPQTPHDPPRGLQFEGTCTQLKDAEEIAFARSCFQGRIFDGETIDSFIAHQERPHRFYKITPKKFVLFDVVNYPDDPRQELDL